MKTKAVFLILLLLIAVASFARTVEVDDSCLRLNDLYTGLSNDELICNLNYGDEKKLPKERMRNELIARKIDIRAYPPREFQVVRKGVPVSEELLQTKIEDALRSQYPETRIDIEKITYRNNIFMDQSGFLDVQVPRKGFGSVYATVFNGVKQFRVYVYVRAYKSVQVTTDKVRRGEPFTGKVALQDKEITKIRGELIENTEAYIARQNIAAGKILTSRIVKGKPINFEGDMVSIVYQSSTIRIATTGMLEENAYPGKQVRVRNMSSGKIVYAKADRRDRYLISSVN